MTAQYVGIFFEFMYWGFSHYYSVSFNFEHICLVTWELKLLADSATKHTLLIFLIMQWPKRCDYMKCWIMKSNIFISVRHWISRNYCWCSIAYFFDFSCGFDNNINKRRFLCRLQMGRRKGRKVVEVKRRTQRQRIIHCVEAVRVEGWVTAICRPNSSLQWKNTKRLVK